MARVLTLSRSVHHWCLLWARETLVWGRSMSSLEERARSVFAAAVEGVQPDRVVSRGLQRRGDELVVGKHSFNLSNNLYLVGFGKAVLGMAAEAERIVGDHLVQGLISVPYGIQETLQHHGKLNMLLGSSSRIKVMEGAKHNLPDIDALRAAESIRELVSALTERDLLLVLISGGGSALLPAPVPPITLQEKQEVIRRLAASGATIQELNTVRRPLSLLKGGGLANYAYPAQVVALILSDVIGDPLDFIASGPTVRSKTSAKDVWAILDSYALSASLPSSLVEVINKADSQQLMDRAQDNKNHVLNTVIGSNTIALDCAARKARELGLRPVVLSPGVCGDIRAVAQLYGLLSQFACSPGKEPPPELVAQIIQLGPEVGVETWDLHRTMKLLREGREETWCVTCLLAGGEPTVQLLGKGRGGRNQELAFRVGLELSRAGEKRGAVFLSGGTDGQDGPTEAAGAVTDSKMEAEARSQGLDIDGFLNNNDSFTFFSCLSQGQRLLLTGLTGTNVMDVHVMLLPPPPSE